MGQKVKAARCEGWVVLHFHVCCWKVTATAECLKWLVFAVSTPKKNSGSYTQTKLVVPKKYAYEDLSLLCAVLTVMLQLV
jgi:hypothetical protein